MSPIADHPMRYPLANELHARPFPVIQVPAEAIFLAVKREHLAASRDREADLTHLLSLLARHGAPHPQPGATHYFGAIGRHELKWESHTEVVTYSAFAPGLSERPFDPASFAVFPADWLAQAPGLRLTSAIIRVEIMPESEAELTKLLAEWFVAESLTCSRMVDGQAVVASDFRIDPAGHVRFVIFARPGTGPRRIGRIVQRLCEVELYKTLSMLGLARTRALAGPMGEIDTRLSTLVSDLTGGGKAERTLDDLLAISAELETLLVRNSFRFGATGAYEAIVNQRVAAMREERLEGYQTFAEFMMRRYDPAMRTVKSAERRLQALATRAARAGELLRTRVDVERSAENQALLASMDRRADLQLRLQHTVEGLSVVAISYYAVSLATYFLLPLAEAAHWPKSVLTAVLVPLVAGGVWLALRRIRRGMEH